MTMEQLKMKLFAQQPVDQRLSPASLPVSGSSSAVQSPHKKAEFRSPQKHTYINIDSSDDEPGRHPAAVTTTKKKLEAPPRLSNPLNKIQPRPKSLPAQSSHERRTVVKHGKIIDSDDGESSPPKPQKDVDAAFDDLTAQISKGLTIKDDGFPDSVTKSLIIHPPARLFVVQIASDLKDLPKLPPDGRGIKHKSLAPAKASKATEEEETLDVNDFELVDAKTAAEDLKNIFDAPQEASLEEADEWDGKIEGFNTTLLPHQIKGVAWMKEREANPRFCRGGLLADDMGLGKTIQTLATVMLNKPNPEDRKKWSKSTLSILSIVGPVAVMQQWHDEAKKWCGSHLRVYLHYGPKRIEDHVEFRGYHLVITSYSTVASEFKAMSENLVAQGKKKTFGNTALFDYDWYRVVLDEAHNIKNRTTKTSLAVAELSSNYRWALTGTPVQNAIDDLYGILRFLNFESYNDWAYFADRLSRPLKAGRAKLVMKRLSIILKKGMLRRTKASTETGKPLLELPERIVDVIKCQFDEEEQAFYNALESKVQLSVSKFMKNGTVMSNYTSVLTLLLRLRQACDHPSLVSKSFTADDVHGPQSSEQSESSINTDLSDLMSQVNLQSEPSEDPSFQDIVQNYEKEVSARSTKSTKETLLSSSKTRKISELLQEIKKRPDKEKTIIFSQFTGMLDIVEDHLKAGEYRYVRYDGSMNNVKKEESLRRIREDPSYTILLISFKAGGVGINLTCCNNVILIDLWWNPALEEQAFDRAHRMGQTRKVSIYKLTIEETVEDRILQLQSQKRALSSAVLSGAKLSGSRLDQEQLLALIGSKKRAVDDESEGEEEVLRKNPSA